MRIEFELNDQIWERINQEAESMGITPEDLLRVELGRQFREFPQLIGSTVPMPLQMPIPTKIPDNPLEFFKVFVQEMMAAQGQLNCFECTRRLTPKEAKARKCSHCGAELD